jgi:hypothetical protein
LGHRQRLVTAFPDDIGGSSSWPVTRLRNLDVHDGDG